MPQKMLYFISPSERISPFDITIAADAGFDHIIPFPNVLPKNVIGIVQDAIFARAPQNFNDTGIFIGGRDVHLAADMFRNVKKAMVGPFQASVFADPNGAYTTSASILALVRKSLEDRYKCGLKGLKVTVFGTGPVGLCTAILAAKEGAVTQLCALTSEDDEYVAKRFCERYQVDVNWVSALTHSEKSQVLEDSEIVICAAIAGVRIIEQKDLDSAKSLRVVLDTNAVPPSGVEGIGLQDLNSPRDFFGGTFSSIGALAIGNIKSQTELSIFRHIQTSEKVAFIDLPDAYQFALSLVQSLSNP